MVILAFLVGLEATNFSEFHLTFQAPMISRIDTKGNKFSVPQRLGVQA